MIYGDWMGRWGLACPDKEAVFDAETGRRYTYGQMAQRVHKLANFLSQDLGIAKGEFLACLSFNRLEYVDLFFAAGRLGAVLVPLNTRAAHGELAYFLRDAGAKVLFFDVEHAAEAGAMAEEFGGLKTVSLDPETEAAWSLPAAWPDLSPAPPPPVEIEASDPQLIIYTSGTTGLPKGVILTHGMITWNALNSIVGWDMHSADSTVSHPAMFYTAGWNVFTLPMFLCRGRNILVRGFEAAQVLRLIGQEKITVFFGVPTMYQMMAASPEFAGTDFSSLRFAVSGGAPMDRETAELYQKQKGLRIWEGYGLSEIGPNNFMANGQPGTFGQVMPFVDAKIVDDQGRELPPGGEGEILLRGPHCCAGYLNKPEATAEAIRDGWFFTGDLGRRDQAGAVSIVGRKKDMIISGGINIYPAEIERVLAEHPAVAGVAVIGVPDPKWGEVPKAVVEPNPGAQFSRDDMTALLAGRLGKFKTPKYLALTAELPRTAASGKVRKFLLKEHHGGADDL